MEVSTDRPLLKPETIGVHVFECDSIDLVQSSARSASAVVTFTACIARDVLIRVAPVRKRDRLRKRPSGRTTPMRKVSQGQVSRSPWCCTLWISRSGPSLCRCCDPPSLREILRSATRTMLNTLSPSDPVLLLAVIDGPSRVSLVACTRLNSFGNQAPVSGSDPPCPPRPKTAIIPLTDMHPWCSLCFREFGQKIGEPTSPVVFPCGQYS